MTKEDQYLFALIEDKMHQCVEQYRMTYTYFLDMRQRTLAEQFCRSQKGVRWAFYGGYPDAERMVLLFLPEYMEVGANCCDYFMKNPMENPLCLIRAEHGGYKKLSHRDYLGSFLGLGLERTVCGDLLVREDGCDFILLEELADFVLLHYGKAGHEMLKLHIEPMEELIVPKGLVEEVRDTVASLRVDSVVASAFSMSRAKAAAAVQSGIVFINGVQIAKPDAGVNQGDKLVFRGKGKVVIREIGKTTKKERIVIEMNRYL